jgi:serine/threonine protein kinase
MDSCGALVAIKQMQVENKNIEVDTMLKEIGLLSQFEHPNIVQYLGSQLVNDHLVIVMEYVAGGPLSDIVADFHSLKAPVAACYAHDVLKGLSYLHANKILHRDVKPQNVLVGKEGTCKLADFGTAGKLDDNSCVGTLYYMSPEAMKGMWDQASDIWSFGVMLFQMFTGELPFASLQGTNVFSIMYHLRESNFQLKDISFIQDEARDMMGSCLQVSAGLRPTADELLQHVFFQKYQDDLNKHAKPLLENNRYVNRSKRSGSMSIRITSPVMKSPVSSLNISQISDMSMEHPDSAHSNQATNSGDKVTLGLSCPAPCGDAPAAIALPVERATGPGLGHCGGGCGGR